MYDLIALGTLFNPFSGSYRRSPSNIIHIGFWKQQIVKQTFKNKR